MKSQKEEDYWLEAVSVDMIMEMLSNFIAAVIILLLDSCRDNELNTTFKGSKGAQG